MSHRSLISLGIPLFYLSGCTSGETESALFKLLSADQTGVAFANTITTSDSLNVQTDVYVYNGAGVAVGDIDNDGLQDLFFAGNMVSSRLYLNEGNMRFDDITERAGVKTDRWATGASMVDINSDGFLDIYVSVSGPEWSKPNERANLLFINNGDRTFTEAAAQYGIGDTGFTTHALFLDYDGNGCLDLFLLTNSPADFSRVEVTRHPAAIRGETPGSYNQLYRNNCNASFTDVSKEAGILRDAGYGLGAVATDLNGDGRTDIYVSNDGMPNDVLYVNNGDGTFTDKAARWLKHTSYAGMGVDIADFNNDGWLDILQVDMMPRELSRRKRTTGFMTYSSLMDSRSRGYRDDYSVNTLQLSNGVTLGGDVIFSEIGRLAGVAATDWSWSALFADFDNDGLKDIFIGNGYPKAVNDLDYQMAMFGVRRSGVGDQSRRAGLDMLKALHTYEEPNHVFRNSGDLTFSDKTRAWGMDQPSFSYGAAYADLNNDGRLDLVVNNIDAPAFIYENLGRPGPAASHYLQIRLQGESPNVRGVGTKLTVTAGGQKQHIDHTPYRGFMSSMDDRVHFGLGRSQRVDTLEIEWPDGRQQTLTNLDVDQLLVVKQSDAAKLAPLPAQTHNHLFEPLTTLRGLTDKHRLGNLLDYSTQPLLPYLVSRQGPALAVGDVNRDSLDDVFVGGGGGVPGKLLIQRKDGSFVSSRGEQPWIVDKAHEDWGALFFDANGDSLPDLYVASGGYHLTSESPLLQDRLYINRGNGAFAREPQALPAMLTSTAAVRAADFNGDGRLDLFVGGRLTPRSYPLPTRSYLLRNDGGRFTDVTEEVAPEMARPHGMITDAVWMDFDADGRMDLVTAGEWMPLTFYRNDGKRLHNVTQSTQLPPMRGWWFSLITGDFDNDGRSDLVAGNIGLNYSYSTSKDSTFSVYAADFTGSRSTDIVLAQKIAGKEYPISGFAPLARVIYPLGVRYPTYGAFANISLLEAFGPGPLNQAIHYEIDTFASVYLRNAGNGTFAHTALPNMAQISPIRGLIAHDIDSDKNLDLLIAGNLYDVEPNTPRADAGNGLWLRGDGQGHFAPVPTSESGFLAPLNANGLALVSTATGKAVFVANTGDSLQAFTIKRR